jgi:hypothetical protein
MLTNPPSAFCGLPAACIKTERETIQLAASLMKLQICEQGIISRFLSLLIYGYKAYRDTGI